MTPYPPLSYEPRPRDFSARLKRSRRSSLGQLRRKRHMGRHAAMLVAAVAVPAFAGPRSWSDLARHPAAPARAEARAMPFETPGASFRGSAFDYLSLADQPLPAQDRSHSDAGPPAPGGEIDAGPAARSLRIDAADASDRARAQRCLTAAVYYEAASESDAGQRAVAQVVLNRVAHPAYPATVCGVVYQGAERRSGCQFTFTCDGSLARAPVPLFWRRAEAVARAALAGYVYAPIGLATHYHTIQVHPVWADRLSYLGTVGAHRFYRFGGGAGRPATFRFAYGGGEPLIGVYKGHAAADSALAEASVDPVAVQRAYAAASPRAATDGEAGTPSAPAYAPELQARGGDARYRAQGLPGASAARPEYADSGQWLDRPGA